MNTELVKQDQNQLSAVQSPVAWAIANKVSPEEMLRYFELQERIDEREARSYERDARNAFNRSFSAFKAEAVAIVKNVVVKDGPLKDKRYADLFGVVGVVTPALSKHDLSHSWKLTKDEPAWMEVTCTIRHALGHSESVSMGAAPDTGPGRNAIQARGSAKSYLERYTLLAATGMAAGGTDDDGAGTGKPHGSELPDVEFLAYRDSIEVARSEEELVEYFNQGYGAAKLLGDKASMNLFKKARDKRKGEL